MSPWRRLVSPFETFGPVAGGLYVVDRLLRRLSPRLSLQVYELMAQPLAERPLLPASLSRNLRCVEIGPDHPDVARMPAREEVKVARFAAGARCLGVYRADDFVGYMWWRRDTYEEDEVRCIYVLDEPQRTVFDFDFYVFPAYRMGIGFLAIWQAANEVLRGQGMRATCCRMTRFNVASRRAHARLGARRVGRALFFSAGTWQLGVADRAPFLHLSLSPGRPMRLPVAGASALRRLEETKTR